MSVRQIGRQAHGLAKALDGSRQVVRRQLALAQVHGEAGGLAIDLLLAEPIGLRELGRALRVVLPLQHLAEAQVGLGELRAMADRLAELGERRPRCRRSPSGSCRAGSGPRRSRACAPAPCAGRPSASSRRLLCHRITASVYGGSGSEASSAIALRSAASAADEVVLLLEGEAQVVEGVGALRMLRSRALDTPRWRRPDRPSATARCRGSAAPRRAPGGSRGAPRNVATASSASPFSISARPRLLRASGSSGAIATALRSAATAPAEVAQLLERYAELSPARRRCAD